MSFKYATFQVLVALSCVMVLLWPVFAYSQVFTFYFNPNNITNEVTVIRKCGFIPPPVSLMSNDLAKERALGKILYEVLVILEYTFFAFLVSS
ncbi:hypothetical protein DICVIV_14442 [Dictyocaulus viviparus]|uniref:Uncharacterized protein n=1 Tax=Dictyocaulus viviparus TaxID=29172 RepID=A0A0D8XB28_DICVI|nr:hypothetical protein DICVIV_14442 [Dictyocaulus viviparus]